MPPPIDVIRQPNIAALADHDHTSALYRASSTDEASSVDGASDHAYTSAKPSTRHLRQRTHRTAKTAPSQTLSPERNVILNTRNPLIIWLAKHELQLSLFLLALVHSCYWAGYSWPSLWIRMQHKSTSAGHAEEEPRYVRGMHDVKFVFYWIIQIIAARSILLHHVLPAIPRCLGIGNARKERRFCEMAWSMLYILTSWCIGFRVWQTSPYFMSTNNLYSNYPDDHVIMPYGLKWFYLVQTAFWLSNIYTIHVEERRKDHTEMLAHHVVTIALVLSSYAFHFTRFGHVFMLVMDFPDIFLSAAKMFRYLGYDLVPNVLFGVFSLSWVATKHYLCLKMMISIWTQGTVTVPLERRYPVYPNSYASIPIVSCLWFVLCLLQLILLYWFYLILKVLQRVLIKGEDADDNRSDDEDTAVEDAVDSGIDTASNCSM
ncbi:Sphingosine N-acyltransferase lag1 [Coemansia furcata]|uniref:Sphingosine N-acyltransferase lag1 n=1 Tax=Coemansia furcata TaxID=417177 RepID=A0ACC1LA62_9FUNG|nr:Sphingosine N-acyltransferase lag1 [Coemansia furcata]